MRKHFAAVLGAALLLGTACTGVLPASAETTAAAETVACTFDESTGTLTASGAGLLTYFQTKGIHKKIKRAIIGEGIKAIGTGAFANCTKMTELVLPATLESIAAGAFQNCSALADITFPEGFTFDGSDFTDTAWMQAQRQANPLVIAGGVLVDGRAASGEVVIPAGVTRIAEDAFAGNTAITAVAVPQGVEEIGCFAFSGCTALKKITVLNPSCKLCTEADVLADGTAGVTLCGAEESTICAYAEKFGYTFEVQNGLQTVLDALESYNMAQLGLGRNTVMLADIIGLLETYNTNELLGV